MNPRNAWIAWIAMTIVLAGWVFALGGFVPRGNTQVLEPTGVELREALRFLGFALIVVGATLGVAAGVRQPMVLILAGVVLNLAYEGRVLQEQAIGVIGAAMVLLGCLWGSRVARRMRDGGASS